MNKEFEASVIELHYLPCIKYFQLINSSKKVYIELGGRFYKQTYRNRCKILGSNQVSQLSVPIIADSRLSSRKLKIDYRQTWLKDHTRGLMSAYGRAPFYEHFGYMFDEVFNKKHELLADLCQELLTLCLQLLQLDTEVIFIDNFDEIEEKDVFNARGLIHPKKEFDKFEIKEYTQVFGNDFEDNLSIVDLVFCEGQNSIAFL